MSSGNPPQPDPAASPVPAESPASAPPADPAAANEAGKQHPSPIIRTPDQRLRVFVSSTLQELAAERAATREAISHLHLAPVLFELGARPHPPQDLYRAYLAQSDVFIGIYWQSYGWIAPNMAVSGLEDEYNLSATRPKLIYLKEPAEREPRLKVLLARIREDGTASYQHFQTADELRDLIENDLALLLTERFDQARTQATARPSSAPAASTKRVVLPVRRVTLVDREDQVRLAREALTADEVGLVTLTGPGGAGKTTLALHVAASLVDGFSGGVVFVSLAQITEPARLASAIAAALGIRESGGEPVLDRITDSLRDESLLLVLDNFEQVVDGAPVVAELLAASPQLKILTTSRRRLRLQGEQELSIPPLAVPDEQDSRSLDRLARSAAVQLFVQRTREVKPDFQLTRATGPAVAQICRRLDGLPLAIELAAARVRVLPPKALLAHLERTLPLLTEGARDLPARQQTMRDTIAWSYDLLGEAEQTLFRRLAVFAGGCTLETAEQVCDPDAGLGIAVMDGLQSLLESSLLREEETPEGDARFRMLATIREFALDRLNETEEADTIQRRQANAALALAEQAEPELTSPQRWEWIKRLGGEYENLSAALEWSRSAKQTEMLARLTVALGWFWFLGGFLSEGRRWAEVALGLLPAEHTLLRAKAVHWAAGLAFAQGDLWHAQPLAEESVSQFRGLGDRRELAYALIIQGLVLGGLGDQAKAFASFQESVETFRAEGADPWGEAFALYCLGDALRAGGDLDAARRTYEESLAGFQDLDDHWGRGILLHALGTIAEASDDYDAARSLYSAAEVILRQMGDRWDLARVLVAQEGIALRAGELDRASAACEESLRLSRELGNMQGMLRSLAGLVAVASRQGQFERAATLLGTIDMLGRTGGRSRPEQLIGDVRTHLDGAAFQRAFTTGQVMSLDEAVAFALDEQDDAGDRASGSAAETEGPAH